MQNSQPPFEKNIESVSKLLTLISKLGVVLGGTCVLIYSLRINYFPQDLSVGDGLLFLMAAACFGLIYLFFIGTSVSFGIFLSPLIQSILKIVFWVRNSVQKTKVKPMHPLAPFDWSTVVPSLGYVMLMHALGTQDSSAYWTLPLLSIGIFFFYSIYTSSGKTLKNIAMIKGSLVHTEDKEVCGKSGDTEKHQRNQLFAIVSILVMPLIVGGVSGQLLDAAMRFAHVRIEKPVVYVKEPYASLLPRALTTDIHIAPKEYTAFNGIVILFKGFGKTTVVSFKDGVSSRKLEIPNDQLIIEDR